MTLVIRPAELAFGKHPFLNPFYAGRSSLPTEDIMPLNRRNFTV